MTATSRPFDVTFPTQGITPHNVYPVASLKSNPVYQPTVSQRVSWKFFCHSILKVQSRFVQRLLFAVQQFSFSLVSFRGFHLQYCPYYYWDVVCPTSFPFSFPSSYVMIKNHTQTSVNFCFHHFFNDFKKFHPFVTLPPVATLSLRQWCVSWFLHRSFFYSKTKLDLFPQWSTSKNIQFNDFFAHKSLTANCTFLHENGTFIRWNGRFSVTCLQ